jgi:outer membrane protein insertion porin family
LKVLQRVSAGTVFAALPINVGDIVDQATIGDASRSIFKTGFFADISIIKEEEVLVIVVEERPAISEITLEGNKAIQTEQLMEALTDNGLAEGQIFRQSILEAMAQELQRQYVSQGTLWRLQLSVTLRIYHAIG